MADLLADAIWHALVRMTRTEPPEPLPVEDKEPEHNDNLPIVLGMTRRGSSGEPYIAVELRDGLPPRYVLRLPVRVPPFGRVKYAQKRFGDLAEAVEYRDACIEAGYWI